MPQEPQRPSPDNKGAITIALVCLGIILLIDIYLVFFVHEGRWF